MSLYAHRAIQRKKVVNLTEKCYNIKKGVKKLDIKLSASLILFVILLSGCLPHEYPVYTAIDKELILIGEHRDLIRAEFGAPYCRNGDSWYYFDEHAPDGTVADIRFRDDHVIRYIEQECNEHNYMTWIPLLIESLRDEDIDTRHRGYNFLRFLIKAYEQPLAVEPPDDLRQIPNVKQRQILPVWAKFESNDYEKWQNWWIETGSKSNKYPAYSPMDKYPSPTYSLTDRTSILVGAHRDSIRVKLRAPHCRNGDAWYYFDGNAPGGTIGEINFKDDHVFRYIEHKYDEHHYVIWIPLLIESLRDEDIYIRHRGYRFLRFLVEDYEYRSAVPRLEDWSRIPFESNDYEKWQHWWIEIGKKEYSRYAQ